MPSINLRALTFRLLMLLLLTTLLAACRFIMPPSPEPSATPTPTATATPEPTATSLPPLPQVDYTPVDPDTLSPILVQRSPARGESLLPDGAIELVFDKPMDTQAVTQAFRVLQSGTDEALQGTLSWPNAQTVRFEPAEVLPRDASFDVVLTQDAVSENGEPLGQPYTFRFSTAGYLDVAQVMPAPDTREVETDARITVIFNRPVVPLTSLEEMEGLPDPLALDPPVSGRGEWLNTSIYIFTPDEPLAGGVTYRATVAAGLTDVAGAVLAEDYTWQFGTAPPEIVWVTPQEDAILVDIKTAVTVEFNQPIDPTSAEQAFSLRSDAVLGGNVRGTFDVDGATLTFTPTNALDFDTRYTVNANAGVVSTAGGEGMPDPFTWQFTTVPLPRIVETQPRDGEREAPPHTDFRIVFNTPIDPTTVMDNLTMTPPLSPTQVFTYWASYDNTFILSFGAEPSTDYEVTIGEGIADPYGNTLPRGEVVRFRTAPLAPTYRLLTPDFVGTYDASLPARMVLAHINLNRVNFRLYRLPPDALERSPWEWQERDRQPTGADLIRQWSERLESPLNKQAYTVVDLAETAEGTLTPGVYLLDTESPDVDPDYYRRTQRHILVVSEVNLTLKTGPKDAMVWVTDLTTGQPLPNRQLTLIERDRSLRRSLTTDADGIAYLELPMDHYSIVVYSDQPFGVVSSDWGYGISPWEFGLGEGVSAQPYRSYITTDRPIYRPGQTVAFKGVLRADDDALYSLPGLQDVEVTIRDINYEEIYQERLPVNELGTFEGTLELGEGAALGQYIIGVQIGERYSESYFLVAAYRPPEFEVTVSAEQDEVQRGNDIEAVITASYFFGGPLKNTEVTWNVLAEPFVFEPPWGGRYTFTDRDDPYGCWECWWFEPPTPEPVLSGEGTTDDEGQLHVRIDGAQLSEALDKGAQRIFIEATATGPDHQEIAGRTSAVVHPGPYYIGLRPQAYVTEAGEATNVDLVTVDWEGERLADIAVKVSFYHREWINTFVENESGGGHWTWETEETLVDETTVTTDARGEAVATFTPEQAGNYHVVAEPAEPTSQTQHIRSSVFLWVSGSDYVAWRRENNDRITLISDKTTYQVGETAEILIPSPFEGPHMALVTVEREGIRRHEVIRLENNSTVYRLPIRAEDLPNIYVSVVLIKPRGEDVASGENVADFKMGLIPLDVQLDPKTLTVQVEASAEQVEPGEDVDYKVTVRGPNGEPMPDVELSLDVVDKAVLSLKPRTETILSALYARRRLAVQTSSSLSVSGNRYQKELSTDIELRDEAANLSAADGQRMGMGGEAVEEEMMEVPAEAAPAPQPTMTADMDDAAGAPPPEGVEVRESFADTAAWVPRLVTDGTGQANLTITLPDNLTTWTARAVALNAETQVGEGTAEVVATKPLLIRPVAPRFFVVDDRAQLAANVSNNTNETLEVEVRLGVDGVEIQAETPAIQTVTLPARSEAQVTWWVRVTDASQAMLTFTSLSGDYVDASKPRLATGPDGSLMVLRYSAPDTVGTAGQLTEAGSRTEAIALPPAYDASRGHLTVHLDPSLAAGMREGLDYLEHYEYECTEQTVSRFLPNVLTYQALVSLGIDDPELAERLPGLVQEGLDKLYQQQNPDGGWGWWHSTRTPESNAYVSAYAVFGLLKAQQAGFEVKQQVLSDGVAYLQGQLKQVRQIGDYRDANRQAWLLYVLAEAKAAPQDQVASLYEHREKLSHYARAYLAQTIWLRNPDDDRLDTLLSDLNNDAILSATGAHWEEAYHDWWAMNTDTRSTAIILDTLAKLDPQNALIPNVVRWLMVARKGGIWETTQETAWALIAFTDWMVETGELDANYDFALFLNDAQLAQGQATPETVQESMQQVIPISDLRADLTNALSIARTEGPGRLYYTAHLQVFLPVEEIEPADRGFVVYRRYTLASCTEENRLDCPEVREVPLGETIRVDLTVITPHDRYYVVVEDPLPAGGEAVDTGLATTSLLAMGPQVERQDSPYWWWWNWYTRSEMRDEKVVLFTDYLPAGTYEYSYTFRTTLPGDYHVIPTTASEFYFPEVFGRSEGRLLTIGE